MKPLAFLLLGGVLGMALCHFTNAPVDDATKNAGKGATAERQGSRSSDLLKKDPASSSIVSSIVKKATQPLNSIMYSVAGRNIHESPQVDNPWLAKDNHGVTAKEFLENYYDDRIALGKDISRIAVKSGSQGKWRFYRVKNLRFSLSQHTITTADHLNGIDL